MKRSTGTPGPLSRTRGPGVPVPAALPGHHGPQPGVGHGPDVHPHAPRVPLPGRRAGLGDPPGPSLAIVQHTDHGLLSRRPRGRRPGARLPRVLNTDQGSQFTSTAFVALVQQHGIALSMDGRGAWRDNLFVERLWKTVKYEEVYLHAYDSVSETQRHLAGGRHPDSHSLRPYVPRGQLHLRPQ